MLDNKHAELAPPCDKDKEGWYLPSFGVYHPQKLGKICVVFDSSAQFAAVSLSDMLLTGPDLNSTLLGVLNRFRKELFAITVDRMRVHVFGNSPSPAVAIFGLRKAAREAAGAYGSDAQRFIERGFYVDDALKSFPNFRVYPFSCLQEISLCKCVIVASLK